MKQTHRLLLLIGCILWIGTTSAQVTKQVEVTKDYVPQIEQATKLPIQPDLTDTTRMRPEIDYTITPSACNTSLEVRPIRPATMSYWEVNRPTPFYVKAATGYPLHSIFDFRASTQRPESGYLLGKIDHRGRWSKIRNDFGIRQKAQQMENRIGGAAGKYFGRYTLEAELAYEQQLRHRYGFGTPDEIAADEPWEDPYTRIGSDDVSWALRFGNQIHDPERVDLEAEIHGNFFFDRSHWINYTDRARQTDLGAHLRLGWKIRNHRFGVKIGYEGMRGSRAIAPYRDHQIHAGARYSNTFGKSEVEMGLDYVYDRPIGSEHDHYLLPYARVNFDLGTRALHPFVEIDGSVQENSYRSLMRQSPWVTPATLLDKSSVSYNGRAGIRGTVWRNRLTYRIYAGANLHDHHNYWYPTGFCDAASEAFSLYPLTMQPIQGRQTVVSFHGEVEFRPISALRIDLGAHGYIRHDDFSDVVSRDLAIGNGEPDFEGRAAIRYAGSKISATAELSVTSTCHWAMIDLHTPSLQSATTLPFEAPTFANLRVQIEGRILHNVVLFAEGDNLLNRRRYVAPWMRDYGICGTLGVKISF